jgi:acyl CoA:acetate/3-ketoacid CoA transferase alpha subunit
LPSKFGLPIVYYGKIELLDGFIVHRKWKVNMFEDLLQKYFALKDSPDRGKIMPAREAISKFIEPGMCLHFAITHNRASAMTYELTRQFWGKDPQFEVISIGLTAQQSMLIHGGLVKTAHSSFYGDSFPTPGPNPIIARAYQKKTVDLRHWSIYSLPQALMAGAMGVPFMPTRSLVGSTMAEENAEAGMFAEIENPFEGGGRIGVIKAMQPDYSFIHAWAADKAGNLLLTPPYGPDVWGCFAAKKGVIASVEKIVDADFMRRHSPFVRVPGYLVRSISVTEMGAHPAGMSSVGVPEMDAYADDYQFLADVRQVYKDRAAFDKWIEEWVLEVKDQQEYLKKLGSERVIFLKGKARGDSWQHELREWEDRIDPDVPASPAEKMILAASRKMIEIIKRHAYRTVLAGVGASNLAAWMAHSKLSHEDYPLELMAEIGFYGYSPRPADPFIFNYRNLSVSKGLTELPRILGLYSGGATNRCLGALGAAQVDKNGNINTTCIPGVMLFVGSGGGNDVASAAQEVVVVAMQDKLRFVEQLPYTTSPGKKVSTLVSTLGVYEKGGGEELVLTGYFPIEGKSEEEVIKSIKEHTGWELKVDPNVRPLDEPDREELTVLRMFDPQGNFLGKLARV